MHLHLTGQIFFEFLKHYGYWVMLPLMIVEGPVVTLFAAIMASLGAFNVWIVLVFSILGDLIGDAIFYGLGYRFGMGFVNSVGKHMGITPDLIGRMEKYFQKHGGKTIFAVKSTTGLCWTTFTAAGIVKMDFKKFMTYSFFGGIVWSGFLVSMGYFYGYLWKSIKQYISWVGWIVFTVALISFVIITLYKKKKSEKFLQ